MKRIIVAVVAVAAAVMFLAPQASHAAGLKGGVELGLNYSTFMGSDATDAKSKAGFAIGGFLNVGFTDLISLQPELLYTQKGASDSQTTNISYLEIPILVKFSFLTDKKVSPNVFVGPSLAFLLAADTGGPDISSNLNGFDYGAVIGAGVNIGLGGGALIVNLRYDYGLADIAKEVAGRQPDVKNGALSLMVGYQF